MTPGSAWTPHLCWSQIDPEAGATQGHKPATICFKL